MSGNLSEKSRIKMRNPEIWEWEIGKSGNLGVGNREIRKCGLPKSRNPEMWAPEIEKSGNVGSRNREILETGVRKRGNPGNRGLKTGKSGKPGQLEGTFGPDLAQPAPKWGTFWSKLPRGPDKTGQGPADSPARPQKRQICPPPGGVYILGSGGRFGPAIYGETYRKSP